MTAASPPFREHPRAFGKPGHPGRRRELGRKAIHISSLAFPIFVWLVPRPTALLGLGLAVAVAVVVDTLRLRVRSFARLFYSLTRGLLRGRERRGFVGATWMMVAYFLAVLIFPTPVAVAAMAYNALGDASAALVGRRFGRVRLMGGKTLEGAMACVVACFLVGVVIPGIPLHIALIGAIAASALELGSLPPDDNLWMTLGGGAVLWLALATLM